MTYDVQRYQVMENLLMPLAYGRPATITFATVVLAADAEAHEQDRLAAQALTFSRDPANDARRVARTGCHRAPVETGDQGQQFLLLVDVQAEVRPHGGADDARRPGERAAPRRGRQDSAFWKHGTEQHLWSRARRSGPLAVPQVPDHRAGAGGLPDGDVQRLQQQEDRFKHMLEKNPDFTLSGFFEQFYRDMNIIPETGWAARSEQIPAPCQRVRKRTQCDLSAQH